MKQQKNFTTTLPATLLANLNKISNELKIPKNSIIEMAFSDWEKKHKQDMLRSSYKNASIDPEWQELSEMGLRDWK
jgi:hypothetical protein